MPFRINNNTPAGTALGIGPAAKAAEAPPPPEAQDGLQLSKSAATLSRIAENDAAARSQKVSKLAAAGKTGSYKVESAAVSKAIVDHAIAAGQGSSKG
jgi:anti-sigma28 factor (negative regulator of flagellin synthesis)